MQPAVTVGRTTIGWGDGGALTTLRTMQRIVNASISTPVVVEHAHLIVRPISPRNYIGMATEIRDWLSRFFRFVPDPVGVELLRQPDYLLRQYELNLQMTGDCDDVAILGAALGKAVGIPAEFVAVGFQPNGPLKHVFTVLHPGLTNLVVSLDVTKPRQVLAQVRRRYTIPV